MADELSICIAMGVLNEEKRLPRVLDSIKKQDYPRNRVQIMIADGGSSDKTIQIAKAFGAQVFDNPRKLGDYGIKMLAEKASCDLFLPFAADNEFPGQDWLKFVSGLFLKEKEASAFWGRIRVSDDDSNIARYYELIQNDPLSYFLNNNLKYYLKITEERLFYNERYYLFKVTPRYPLITGANGFVYRFAHAKNFFLAEYIGIENDIYQTMVEQGYDRLIYAPGFGVYHHCLLSLSDWGSKWKRNYEQHFLLNYKKRNLNWIGGRYLWIKLALWPVYSLVPIFSFIHSIIKAIFSKNIFWLYHAPASFLQTVIYIKYTLFTKNGRDFLCAFSKGAVIKNK